MSGTRLSPNPWLSDQVLFTAYRWLAWCATAIWILGQGAFLNFIPVLAGTLLYTMAVSVLARQYLRLARQTPAVMSLDILVAVAAIAYSGGWESPFMFFAYGSLVLPAILFGWLGGVMAGLLYAALYQAAMAAAGTPAANRLFEDPLAGVSVPLSILAPPLFGALFALIVDRLRHQSAHHGRWRDQSPEAPAEDVYSREPRLDTPRFPFPGRDEQRLDLAPDAPLTTQLTRTRTVEPKVEELRRVIFAPMPAPDLDLAPAIDVLMTRFGQQTGLSAQLSSIGRMRPVRSVHRELLVRLTQEALINIRQHAQAGSVSLTLRYDVNSVALLIQDDGVGLVDGTYQRPGLHTLRAMQYRVSEFGGRLDVFETEGGGVTVRATMPLE